MSSGQLLARAPFLLSLGLAAFVALPAAAELEVDSFTLDNGMEFLVVPRPGSPMVAAAWVAHVGSGDETSGTTGVSHLLEHLMFRGSRRIGSRDIAAELALLDRRERLAGEISALPPEAPDRRRRELARRAEELDRQLRELHFKGEYALVYTEAGAVGINALTREDLTLYYMMLPLERLETWFWMESDRLSEPVFREFWGEYDIVEEERRQRISADPTGPLGEAFEAAYWGASHPYSWRPIGRREDLRAIDLAAAKRHFERYYTGHRLTAALVGDLDLAQVRVWAERYFGRLAAGPLPASPPPPGELPRGVRLEDTCSCPTQVETRYRTVPFGHPDAAALDVLAGVLNGRAGRLHQSLVLAQEVAFAASAVHAPLRRDGSFSVRIEARQGVEPERLEAAWAAELDRLLSTPVSARELQSVKNRLAADSWREVKAPLSLALRLLVYDALGSWEHVQSWPAATAAVTPDDIRRIAETYLRAESAAVLVARREEAQ